MRVRYKGVVQVRVCKGNIEIIFNPGEEKEIMDEIGNDLLKNPYFEKVETKTKFLKTEGGE